MIILQSTNQGTLKLIKTTNMLPVEQLATHRISYPPNLPIGREGKHVKRKIEKNAQL